MEQSLEFWTMARHKISGFEGVVLARTVWSNGCVKYYLAPKGLKPDGSPMEGVWFDSQEVEGATEDAGGGPMPLCPAG